jgi:arylsulfatase A-like enzyme
LATLAILGGLGCGLWSAETIRIEIHADTLRRIEAGPFSKSELERDIYFRSYHVPGMFSDERSRELLAIGAVPGRGTNSFPLEPGGKGEAFSAASRRKSLEGLVDTYGRAAERYPGMVHALAHNHFTGWMRQSAVDPQTKDLLEDWEKLSKADVLRTDLYEPMADLLVDWFSNLKKRGVDLPNFYSVKNEPTFEWKIGDFNRYTIGVARKVHPVHPEVRITGPCSAWPYPGAAFDKWSNREKLFIDAAGGEVGGYDLHFYSKGFWSLPPEPKWQAQCVVSASLHESQRLGVSTVWDFGRSSAYLDLWNAYHLATWGGELKPMIISEFGRQTIHPQFGPWLNDFKPWLYMNTVVRQWMNFMDRPEVRLTVPFILPESDEGYAPRRGQAVYTRPGAPESLQLTRTRFHEFFSFFRDLRGTRVDYAITAGVAKARGRLFVQPFREGRNLNVLIHNGGGYPRGSVKVELAVLLEGLAVRPARIAGKRIFFEGPVPAPEAGARIDGMLFISPCDGYEPVEGPVLELAGEETRIVRIELDPEAGAPVRERIERRIYSTDTLAPLAMHRDAEARVHVAPKRLAEAVAARLVLSLARNEGFERNPTVLLNGRGVGQLDLSFSRGVAEFHAPVEVGIPVDALRPGENLVKVRFDESVQGGHPFLVSTRLDLIAERRLAARPNIVLIVVDDLGYGDLGAYGGKTIPTPHLDRLAVGGVRFSDGYVTAPVCAPSRLGLLTGVYQQRLGVHWNQDVFPAALGHVKLPPGHPTLPEVLRSAGYTTAVLGKWNLSMREAGRASDEAALLMNFGGDYFPGTDGIYRGVDGGPIPKDPVLRQERYWGPRRAGDEYLTDRIGRLAVEFLARQQGAARPFFLYVGFNAPHSPFQAKLSHQARFGHLGPGPLNYYAAMVFSLDENVGRIIDELRRLGLSENTLVAFVSDNGPSPRIRDNWDPSWPDDLIIGSAGPFSGCKGGFREGGIRVPLILHWPARLRPGEYRRPVSALDLYPTLCAVAGAALPVGDGALSLDGVDLLPFLRGERSGDPHAKLYWRNDHKGAIREGDWKLLLEGSKPALFHLEHDPAEQHDLAAAEPATARRLHQAWRDWCTNHLPPATARLALDGAILRVHLDAAQTREAGSSVQFAPPPARGDTPTP